jgi:hypothetical protein
MASARLHGDSEALDIVTQTVKDKLQDVLPRRS